MVAEISNTDIDLEYQKEAVVVVIVWQLDLQLPVQSVPITPKVVRTNPGGVPDTILCDKVCQWLVAGRWFSPGNPVSSTNRTDCQDVTEIFLKVVLNTIKPYQPT